ncbi:MAG TPA: single-stranded DNA-binding protein [Acidimicrobiales bacterium]|nr:single-stranded DNA-binding protein [Acidimicrobiales bacterium]
MLNMVVVIGKLAKPLQVRSLPNGISLACFDLQVLREDQSADTVPVALFEVSKGIREWVAGTQLLVVGRVRRRFFRVGGGTQSRTEVVAEMAVPLEDTRGTRTALMAASSALAGFAQGLGP